MSTKNMQSPNGGGTIRAMPQSLARVVLHIAFTTKNRVPFLKEVDLRSRLHAYMAGVLQNIGCEPILILHPKRRIIGRCRFRMSSARGAESTDWKLTNDMYGIDADAGVCSAPVGAWENV